MRHAAKKLSLSAPIGTCREMAVEAERLAGNAGPPGRREKYLDLARQWTELADEMDAALEGNHDEANG
jgi:hypothetical protein